MVDLLVRGFPEKLRLTAAVLGCTSQKDLCAAFRRVNPNTDFDLERSYKWMQGRSLPRSARVYEDWLALLGMGEASVSWLMSSPIDQFVEALALFHKVEASALLRQAGVSSTAGAAEVMPHTGPNSYLCGVYACYSHAQSPYFYDHLVRATLVIEPAPRRSEGLVATYSQRLPMGRVHASGTVGLYGAALSLELRAPGPNVAPVFCSLFRPSPPGSVLVGVMCGTAAINPAGQPPYTTRIIMVRIDEALSERVEASNRYLDRDERPISSDLEGLGIVLPDPVGLEALAHRVLNPSRQRSGFDQVAVTDYTALAMACDQIWLNGLGTWPPNPQAK
ncbi:hypothetical protein JMJ56_18670 [Belnapia sp. T18]|uniref:Uncharacterized protein n=1 Tax=Belnapia arida TaxID=2804533 RepID=A0ABS1U7W4_9PROT|nr:hypothetical protein [Belnapia arida]MBL6080049.1 hypothetical protein [Belnapia arida]